MPQVYVILKKRYTRPRLPERLTPVSPGAPRGRIDAKKCAWPYTFTAPIVMNGLRQCAKIVLTVA